MSSSSATPAPPWSNGTTQPQTPRRPEKPENAGASSPDSADSTPRIVPGMRRIGDILVGANGITENVRDKTLSYMRANRVTFGSAILELGGIPEEMLLRALSVQFSSPPVSARELASIPPEVIQLVPLSLAHKYASLPFRKVGRTLYVAMARPRENKGAAEIAFFTGLKVIPHVAITARLHVALEKYYGILASFRHKALVAKLERLENPDSAPLDTAEASRRHARGTASLALHEISPPDWSSDPWMIPSGEADSAGGDDLLLETFTLETSQAPLRALDFVPEPPAPEATGPTGLVPAVPRLPVLLAYAERPDEIGAAILDSLPDGVGAAALFRVQGDQATIWRARPESRNGKHDISVQLSEPSLFATLRNSGGVFTGPCPDTPADRRILEALGAGFPAVIGVVPVTIREKTVLFLLTVESPGGPHAIQDRLLRWYAEVTGIALQMFALKSRLKEI